MNQPKVESNLFRMYLTNLNDLHGFDWLIKVEYYFPQPGNSW